MTIVQRAVEDFVYAFDQKIGARVGGRTPERVMSDALYRLAGELSLEALQGNREERERRF